MGIPPECFDLPQTDFTADDIGKGADREGNVVWAPDSRRFASLSIDLAPHRGNLFSTPRPSPRRKKTAVYQVSGDSWDRVELPLDVVPSRESDVELRGAILGQDYVEPIRWQTPNVLLLERDEYYEKLEPLVVEGVTFESIVGFARSNAITARVSPDGKATLDWKRREDR